MANVTTIDSLPPQVAESFAMKLLAIETPNLIHKLAAMPKRLDKNSGSTLVMSRYKRLDTATVPLSNSSENPPPQQLDAVNIKVTPKRYGTYIILDELVTLQRNDPVLNSAAMVLGMSLRQTEDELTRDMLASTASSINAVGGTNGDSPTNITDSDVSEITRVLLSSDAHTMMENVEAEDKFGTAPIRNSFMAFSHSDLSSDLESVSGFVHTSQYPDSRKTHRAEWGAIGNVRFFLSSVGSKDANASDLGKDVYNVFVTGMEAYACVEQNGYSTQFIYNSPMVAGGPLRLHGTAGYKFMEAPVITNDTWVIKLRVTRS